MFVVDTNVLLYAANGAAPEHEKCAALLDRWRRDPSPWFTTWGILYEFLRVATHPKVFPRPLSAADAWSFVEALTAGSLQILLPTGRHAELASLVLKESPHV